MFNWLKVSSKRRTTGVIIGGLCVVIGGGLIASSYV